MGKNSALLSIFFITVFCSGFLAGLPAKASCQSGDSRGVLSGTSPVLEIKRIEPERPEYSIELRDVQLIDFFRVIARDYKLNILMEQSICGTITASLTNISLEEALDAIAELSNLTIERKGNVIKVSPNPVTKILVLKYGETKKLPETAGQALTDACGALSHQVEEPGNRLIVQEQALQEEETQSMVRQKKTHEQYVSELGKLLNRQNMLLEEGKKMELEMHREEENVKKLERKREETFNKLLEQPAE